MQIIRQNEETKENLSNERTRPNSPPKQLNETDISNLSDEDFIGQKDTQLRKRINNSMRTLYD